MTIPKDKTRQPGDNIVILPTPRVAFTHIGVRESTKTRIEASRQAYIVKIGHRVSMAEYMDALSKVHLPFTTDHDT